jgi:hypothetical protein
VQATVHAVPPQPTGPLHAFRPLQQIAVWGPALVIDPLHEPTLPQRMWHEPGPSHAIVVQEPVPEQLMVHPLPPHATAPLQELVPVQSIVHELASRQSTPPPQPVTPHETWQGTPEGHTTVVPQRPVCVQSNEHPPPSRHLAPIGHGCAQTGAPSSLPASPLLASVLAASVLPASGLPTLGSPTTSNTASGAASRGVASICVTP